MNTIDIKSNWHKESYDQFLNEFLPQLLAERLPLAGYQVESTGDYTCSISITLATDAGGTVDVRYVDLPQPDAYGTFMVNGKQWTVVPLASSPELEQAEILCVGDMLHEMLAERLGDAPSNLPWDEALLRAYLPLETWLVEKFGNPNPSHPHEYHFQLLDSTNWLASRSHLRRLKIELQNPNQVTTPGQMGRLCPYEKPEGPNLGRIGSIAVGATIRGRQLIAERESATEKPLMSLGLTTSTIPLIEHCDANRLLMGANMMRQWLPYDNPESALVQTGAEPDVPGFWCGRNLLTAFVPWGVETVEDGIILSESGARHLGNSDHMLEPGDKLSNRYGTKGVVSTIIPDSDMPTMADGTPAELIFSGMGIHSRLNISQLREAMLGRLARAEGNAIVAPPFHGPSEEAIRERLRAHGLSANGLEPLTIGQSGPKLDRPGLIGYVYWGRTHHRAKAKMAATATANRQMQRQTELEYQALRSIGAVETIREHFHSRAAVAPSGAKKSQEAVPADALAQQLAKGAVTQAGAPTLRFSLLQKRLKAAGIALSVDGSQASFALQEASDGITLARSVPHPWLAEHSLTKIGRFGSEPDRHFPFAVGLLARERQASSADSGAPALPEYEALAKSNDKLARLLESEAPQSISEQVYDQLCRDVQDYFGALLMPDDLQFDSRVQFSGQAVLAPGPHLRHDQVGIGDEMAWTLFGPLVCRELGDADAVAQRTAEAGKALGRLMEKSWIIVNRTPAVGPTSLVAFHPVRGDDRTIRLPSMACLPLDADFDGDQARVFLPITEEGQDEAGARLSLAGHLARDPGLLNELAPYRESMLGLALLSQEQEGLRQIEEIVGGSVDVANGYLTRRELIAALEGGHAQHGTQQQSAEWVLGQLDALVQLGFDKIQHSGISLSPFVDFGRDAPDAPTGSDLAEWGAYMDQRLQQLLATDDFSTDWGLYVLASKCGAMAENRVRLLTFILFARGIMADVDGNEFVIPHSLRQGFTPEESFAAVAGAQLGLRRATKHWEESGAINMLHYANDSFHVLARARRAANPGIVFARAAAIGEVDPLVDLDSRLFIGLALQ